LLIDSASADAHRLLADQLAAGTEPAKAIIVLRHWLRTTPKDAAEAYERLSRLASESGDPRASLGAAESLFLLGRPHQALGPLEKLPAEHPELTAEFLHLFGMLAEHAPALAPRLVPLFEALEPRSPLPVAVHFARGLAQFHAGMAAAAAASFREVLQSAPER